LLIQNSLYLHDDFFTYIKTFNVMKKILIVAMLCGFAVTQVFAQVTISLGTYTGASSSNVLLSTSTTTNKYSRTISLYSASEIFAAGGLAGTITSLAWDKGGSGEYQFNDAYIKIFIKHRTDSVWPTSPVPVWDTEVVGATEVFTSSTYSIPTGTGWKTVAFTTPFIWNGIDNVAIFVEWYRPSTPTADITWGRSTNTNTNSYRVGSTSLSALILFVGSSRPLVQLTITPAATVPVTGINVQTQNSVPAVIATPSGQLQMTATITPSAANQSVNWSLLPGTGSATISATGLVTAQSNGTVWAKAVSIQDSTFTDSLLITISGQIVPVTGVLVSTASAVPPLIAVNGGTLQMEAAVIPSAAVQMVTWHLLPVTGTALISGTGLVTATGNGTVWVKAVSVQDPTKSDSLLVTITNQIVPVTSVLVKTQGNIPAEITTKGGTLALEAEVLPVAAIQTVTWSITPGTGQATISNAGLVTASVNGTVWAKAVSAQNPFITDSLIITITNQDIGINQHSSQPEFIIAPNPVTQGVISVEILSGDPLVNGTLTLIDPLGRIVESKGYAGGKATFTVGQSGLFVLMYATPDATMVRKVLVVQ
jgi:hypothetical protein